MAWSLIFSDDFNRANETPIASPWDPVNLNLTSNAVVAAASNGRAYLTGDTRTWNAKQASSALGTEGGVDLSYMQTGVRCTDKNNGYMAWHYITGAVVYKVVSGAYTLLAQGASWGATIPGIAATADGSTITALIVSNPQAGPDGWTSLSSVAATDATFGGGKPLVVGGSRSGRVGAYAFYAWDSEGGGGGSSIIPHVMHYKRMRDC